ncbi:MAG TPA: hypothetical protein VGR74_01580 [Actinomycetota bacterium]|jgi:hypothetical protein|nr:hypothetical protein [Actinomycetota bacterium]
MTANADGIAGRMRDRAGSPTWSRSLELWPGPEAAELDRKRAELTVVQGQLAEFELALAASKAELDAFETQYRRALGPRYARLDKLTERLESNGGRRNGQRVAAGTGPQPEELQGADDPFHGGQNWDWVREDDDDRAAVPSGGRGTVPEAAKRLFRLIARRIHPDLASDPEERERRTNLMVQANHAYELGDVQGLRRLLETWERSPDSVVGHGTKAELERVIRRIAQASERLAEIEREVAALEDSAMGWLRRRVRKAASEGWDLLSHMARELDRQIVEAEAELTSAPQVARLGGLGGGVAR